MAHSHTLSHTNSEFKQYFSQSGEMVKKIFILCIVGYISVGY